MPDRSTCSQHSVWVVTLTTAVFTSILLGFAVAISTSTTMPALHPTCDTKYDPLFWQRLTQLFVHETVLLCLISPAVRQHTRDRIHLPGRPWFFLAVVCSAVFEVLAVTCYAAACWNPGWTAAIFMDWVADVTLVGAAAQLAGGIARSRQRPRSTMVLSSRSATPSGPRSQQQQQQAS
ncbi:hypothetical protein PGQ11_011590 [Apiospora arundinis]|uniref:EXPERA domain-containing protein n=1 Tax=Apiospora arundinis TaxID=335852 RepID=A0ABR2I0M8_9PEZI